MEGNGIFTRNEIFSQTNAWNGALEEINEKKQLLKSLDLDDFDQVIFTGCGSTYYLSISAAKVFQGMTGIYSRAVPGGELLMNPDAIYCGNRNLIFAISRSGSTTETILSVENFKKADGGKVVCVTNYPDQPLAKVADLVIAIPEGQEDSVAQTRSFSSMFIAISALAMVVSGREDLFEAMKQLPAIGAGMLESYNDFAKSVGEDLEKDRFYFLGSGTRYGLANEANLKMKEMTLTHTEAFHFLEFRHGPKSMVNEKACIIGLLSESKREYEEKVLEEMKEMGGFVVKIAEKEADIEFNSDLPEEVRDILYLPLLQAMAYYRSIKKELNPDKPRNLTTVVFLD